ncbi:MAG: hypothetical protein JJU46_12895 [Balneolaceae bacterium]|nr:hypothetical protein [Balneolaceae bacterium]MCH8548840.1 hypothetical protein [Balneolaceae bacterium]
MNSLETLYGKIFSKIPIASVVLRPENGKYIIVDANQAFLNVSQQTLQEMIGKDHFRVFPKRTDGVAVEGFSELRASFQYVLDHCEPDRLDTVRYDIPDKQSGTFIEKYWKPVNIPVAGEDGSTKYIIHSVIDETQKILSGRKASQLERKREKADRILSEISSVARIGSWEMDLVTNKLFWSEMI